MKGEVSRNLLVLDTSYTFEMIRQRGLEESVTCRDLGGFFGKVWTVHPFASMLTSEAWAPAFGPPQSYPVNERHTFIEGKVGRFKWLKGLFAMNFGMAQLELFFKLWCLIGREQITVIRTGDPLYLGILAWALSRTRGVPFIIRIGGNYDKIYEVTGLPLMPRLFGTRAMEKRVERFIFKRADLVAGANQDNLDFALRNGARKEYSTLFRYGNLIDRRHWIAPEERVVDHSLLSDINVTPGKFMLYVGRLDKSKHADDVVRTLAYVRGKGWDVKAVIAGEGALRKPMEAMAEELGVRDHLLMIGNRDQGWISQVVTQAGVVISPHMGRALVEVALGAAPIVAYDFDWQGELIKTNETGILVPSQDWEAMGEGAIRLLSDKAYARRMGEAARREAALMLDPERLDEHERNQYEALFRRREAA